MGRGFSDCLKTRKILGVGVGIGIGIGFYECHSKQELIFFDPDSDPDPDVRLRNVGDALIRLTKTSFETVSEAPTKDSLAGHQSL